jgi:very-short-patch-repair endonuclease
MVRQPRLERAAQDHRAQELRREMSGTEWRLWDRLRSRQLRGLKFRRQVPMGPYFADFAGLDARLVVEVDGDHHGDQLVYDARRDHRLGELGYRVLRFWVAEVDENLEGVIEAIADALSTSHLQGPPPTSPRHAGGGRLYPGASRLLGDRTP